IAGGNPLKNRPKARMACSVHGSHGGIACVRTTRMREQTWRLVLAAGALTVAAFGAEAVPITSVHFGEGTLTAKLELWQEDETNNFSVSLLEQFSLGVDYNVAVPQTFLNAKLPWQAEIAPTYHGYPAQFIAADVHLPQQLSVNETTVETLDEWCGPHT